jgi:N-sulfoglucosamine sulfohydrolase
MMLTHTSSNNAKTIGTVLFMLYVSIIWMTSPCWASQATRPNIVLIVSDDHGTDALGCYGNPVVKTPNMDRLAAEGVRFSNAFCTTPSCSPSRSVILTGMHNHANGMYGLEHTYHHFQSFDKVKSLPVYLSAAGYRTARVGKFHIAPERVYKFETVLSVGVANNMQALGRSPVAMADKCQSFITAPDERPFFLYFCMDDPHRGLPFDSWPGPNPFGNRAEGYPGVVPVKYQPEDVIVPPFLPDTPECRAELAQYYQSASRADQGIGRLMKILEQSGKYDNTVVLYISDNGIAFPGAKTNLYDAGIRLPCIVRTPWQKRGGAESQAMISWVDITPTILDFAGALPDAAAFHGRSFKPVLDGEADGWDEVYASHTLHEVTMYYPMRVVRERRFKLIWNLAHKSDFPFARDLWESSTWQSVIERGDSGYAGRSIEAFLHRPEFELYDLSVDPDEIANLANAPEYADTVNRLKEKLRQFQEDTQDPWIVNWQRK